MTSSPIASWQVEGGKVEAMIDFLFMAAKSLQTVTRSHACSSEEKE